MYRYSQGAVGVPIRLPAMQRDYFHLEALAVAILEQIKHHFMGAAGAQVINDVENAISGGHII